MRTVIHLTLSKIRHSFGKNALRSFAILVSMAVVSFFSSFVALIQSFKERYPRFGILSSEAEDPMTLESVKKFFSDIISGLGITGIAAMLLSFGFIWIFVSTSKEENVRFFATLQSIGATRKERRAVSILEGALLYVFPILLGSALGFFPAAFLGESIAKIFVPDYTLAYEIYFAPITVSLVSIVTVSVLSTLFTSTRKKSVISTLKAHNETEAQATHGYRQSYTFRHMPIEERLAKKSVQYYAASYNRISFSFISCALYPIIAILLLYFIFGLRVVDYTPGYGLDVEKMVEDISFRIAFVAVGAFFALLFFGVLNAVYLIRVHNSVRREGLWVYKSIGMCDKSINLLLRYEYRTAVFHSLIILTVICPILISLFFSFI